MESATDDNPGLTASASAEGTLERDPLPAILLAMAEHRSTGVVRIEGVGDVWLDDGRLYLARDEHFEQGGQVVLVEQSLDAALRVDVLVQEQAERRSVVGAVGLSGPVSATEDPGDLLPAAHPPVEQDRRQRR